MDRETGAMDGPRVTPKEQLLLDRMVEVLRTEHRYPTVRELMDVLRVKSPNSITEYIRSLTSKGLLVPTRSPGDGYRLKTPSTKPFGKGSVPDSYVVLAPSLTPGADRQ